MRTLARSGTTRRICPDYLPDHLADDSHEPISVVMLARVRRTTTRLSIVLTGDDPPTEFRIFTAGDVESVKGTFRFDEAAATSVMAEYQAHGIDLMVDYDHASLTADIAPDPANAGKAAGWFNLEVRDGELWAVNVRWTEAAADALRQKEWRFMSPAFSTDKEGRITSLLNVAITNLPATRNLTPLMAASARDVRKLATGAAFADVQTAICAALNDLYPTPEGAMCMDGPWVQDVYDASVVFCLEGAFYEAPYTFDGSKATLGAPVKVKRTYEPITSTAPVTAPVATNRNKRALQLALAIGGESMDPKLIQQALDALIAGDDAKCAEILKGLVASAAGADPGAATDTTDGSPTDANALGEQTDPSKEEDKQAVMAATARLTRITGKSTIGAAVEEVEVWRQSHLKLEAETKKLANERAALELNKRKENAVTLTKLGAETPHTTGLAKGKLCKRLLEEPIQEQNDRVAALLAARGGKLPTDVKPPPGSGGGATKTEAAGEDQEIETMHGTVTVSAREVANCKAVGADLQVYAANKAFRRLPQPTDGR